MSMKRVFRIMKISALVITVLVAGLITAVALTFSGQTSLVDQQGINGVETIKDGFVAAYMVDLDDHDVALVDAGNDRNGKAVLAALARRGLGPDAVKAILLTHGDADHIAGVHLFPQALVMALQPEIPLAEGREARGPLHSLRSPHPNGIHVTRPLHDGESFSLGSASVRVFAVPGHTKGSAAYLMRGVLFLGDSAEASKEGQLVRGHLLFSESSSQNVASLRQLDSRLQPFAPEVKAIAFGHSGMLMKGLVPLTEFAAQAR